MQKGFLSISKVSVAGEEDFVSIRAATMKAGDPGISIVVSVADFAEAVFGRGFRPCKFGEREIGVAP